MTVIRRMEVILAIDGGGSRTRCLAINRRGQIVGQSVAGPSNHLLVNKDTVVCSLAEATDAAMAQAGLNRADVRCVSAGLAGVDYDGRGAPEMDEIFRELGFSHLLINGDMVIAHAGALHGRPGVVALAGTGSAILGIDENKKRVKVGGWGPIYGDEGSAYRIGQNSLFAAARAYDGRGPATALTEAILGELKLKNFRESLERIYVENMAVRNIAALSRIAYEVAEAGDDVARSIFLRAGEELAESVEAAIRQIKLEGSAMLVSYQGAVLSSCAIVRENFTACLGKQNPQISVLPPDFEPVIGAFLLGCEAHAWMPDENLLGTLTAQAYTENKE